ncbi:MAG: DNA-processing protein DprA [Gammaproteobacteria bacterium]|nr:MAG: DNA-processing protein DprA [Gammaproteobacteria bacterium]
MRPPIDTPHNSSVASDETRFWLALNRTTGIGARSCRKLLADYGSPSNVFHAAPDQLRATGVRSESIDALANPDWESVDRDLAWLTESGNRLLTCLDPGYPPLLKEIPDPPALLFVHGDPEYLTQPQLAIVGSRNPSRDGAALAREFSAHLASCGLTITSGLATGIDGAAHQGALQAGGSTVAVTGTGLDRVYPAQHRELAHQIAENGALVSEFPPGTLPLPGNFPRRNRIISGLSLGTLVIEAALRSGSLITARTALEQGREVFAIPGTIHNPLARGCHALIREGAKLVETGDHILEELASLVSLCLSHTEGTTTSKTEDNDSDNPGRLDSEYVNLLQLMGYEPVSVDQLVQRSGLTPEQVSSMLLLLELEDFIAASPGGRYTRSR